MYSNEVTFSTLVLFSWVTAIVLNFNANGFWNFCRRDPTDKSNILGDFSRDILEVPLLPEPFVESMGTCTASLPPSRGLNRVINNMFVRSSRLVIHGCVSPDFADSSSAAGPVNVQTFCVPKPIRYL